MTAVLAFVGSTRTALAAFGLVAAALVAVDLFPDAPTWVIAAPLSLAVVNLATAIATNERLRRGALCVFHAALLALMVAAGIGRLARFEGRVEVAEGAALDVKAVEATVRGPLHRFSLPDAAFVQGPIHVDYRPGIRRAHTRSVVSVADAPARIEVVGDDLPLHVNGYRLYTTHNKGFAPILTWRPRDGAAATGALHLPSYPLFDWQQETRWQPPGGGELRLFLRLDEPLAEDRAWILEPSAARGVLVVHAREGSRELRPGDEVELGGGTLRFERLAGWMGYRIYHDPALPWLLVFAVTAAAGLASHLWRRPLPAPRAALALNPAARS